MQSRLLAAALAALAGCQTAPGPMVTAPPARADIPVATACVDSVPPAPDLLAEAEWAKPPDEFARVKALQRDRLRLLQSNADLRASLTACAAKP